MQSENSPARACLKFQASSFGPFRYSIFREGSGALGADTTRIGEITGRCEPDIPSKVRGFLGRRFGDLKVQEQSVVNVGTVVPTGTFLGAVGQGGLYEGTATHPSLRGLMGGSPTTGNV